MMYERALRPFGIEFKALRPDLILEGSPERCRSRLVVEDKNDKVYILELLKENQTESREKIAETLRHISELGFKEIKPYVYHDGFIHYNWMVQEYIEHIPLKRPDYISDLWRSEKLSDFLMRLRKIDVQEYSKLDYFDIKKYISEIQEKIEKNRPEIGNVTSSYARKAIKNLPDDLPISFCHGDFHPINILWGEQEILSIIDWEFCGYKPEIYDLANLMGCIGIENPKYLESEFANMLINRLRQSYSERSFRYLNLYILFLFLR